jgi:hypothetical protein
MRLLAPSGIEITSAHWGHVAFLVCEYISRNAIVLTYVYLQQHSLKYFKAMNSKKNEKSDQAIAP